MILIEHILGNVKKDPVWQEKLKDATFDLLVLDQREAQKAVAVNSARRGWIWVFRSTDTSFWLMGMCWRGMKKTNVAVVVQINLRDVMVIDLSELKSRSPDELIKTCFELGHALGNQHWKAVTKNNEVYVPLTVATTMMDSVMRTHGFQHLPFRFVKGAEILPLLSNSEARLLFGGAEDTDTHVHVASPLDEPHGSGLHVHAIHSHGTGHTHSHDHDHSHSHGDHDHDHKH